MSGVDRASGGGRFLSGSCQDVCSQRPALEVSPPEEDISGTDDGHDTGGVPLLPLLQQADVNDER